MQKIYIIFILLFVSACSHHQYETVEILWKNQTNATLVRWMWVKWSDGSILTSSHIVRDDNLNYMIWWQKYIVVKRDTITDRAVLSQRVVSGSYMDDIWQLKSVYVWDPISTEVNRFKKITQLKWKVVNPSGSALGYDNLGRTTTLSWIVLTDLSLIPWDSGAPVYDRDGELVDVVHVQ